jgi:hypothetical protein
MRLLRVQGREQLVHKQLLFLCTAVTSARTEELHAAPSMPATGCWATRGMLTCMKGSRRGRIVSIVSLPTTLYSGMCGTARWSLRSKLYGVNHVTLNHAVHMSDAWPTSKRRKHMPLALQVYGRGKCRSRAHLA